MPGFRKWIRNKLSSREDKSAPAFPTPAPVVDAPPFLPAHRAHPLTPSPSSDHLVPASNYGLFQRLPFELRHQILREAFGNRVLHLDLVHDYPLTRSPQSKSKQGDQSQLPTTTTTTTRETKTHCGLGTELVRDSNQPRSWQWVGCVCHRRREWTQAEKDADPLRTLKNIEICDDQCLKGKLCGCNGSRECFVGAIGWLVACRQAYAEGIDVLYSTNTFQISSHALLQDLPRLLLPQRLRSIKALEMLWDLNTASLSEHLTMWKTSDGQSSPIDTLCSMVPETFPNVNRLYVSLQCWIAPPDKKKYPDPITATEEVVLAPIEKMMSAMGFGREYNIAVQAGAWQVLLKKYADVYGSKLKVEREDIFNGRFWKKLGPGTSEGYWICSGWDDVAYVGLSYWDHDIWASNERRWAAE